MRTASTTIITKRVCILCSVVLKINIPFHGLRSFILRLQLSYSLRSTHWTYYWVPYLSSDSHGTQMIWTLFLFSLYLSNYSDTTHDTAPMIVTHINTYIWMACLLNLIKLIKGGSCVRNLVWLCERLDQSQSNSRSLVLVFLTHFRYMITI